jgi:REP element-mobilizing transposase RayT
VHIAVAMSRPRPIHPGSSHLLTRRVTQRQFLLRPSRETREIVLYALAYAALKTGVIIHAVVVMANHIHLVVTDPEGELPRFMQILHRHIANCMNVTIGRRENFWSSSGPSTVELGSDEDVLDKIAYVLANPTAAGLVEDPAEWPGLITDAAGLTVTARRPEVYYRKDGKMPESIELRISPPASESHGTVDSLIAHLRELVAERVRIAREKAADTRIPFAGRAAVLRVDPFSCAVTPEPKRSLRPQFAAHDPQRRRAMLARLRAFHVAYSRALAQWRAGDRTVGFPPGTYQMRILHSVRVEADEPASNAGDARIEATRVDLAI